MSEPSRLAVVPELSVRPLAIRSMKPRIRKSRLAGIFVCFCVVALTAWFALSASFRAHVYRTVPFGGSYSTYDRLADMLRLGMSADEARSLLGRPEFQEDLKHGQRWSFSDDGPTAGWTCVVDFSSDTGSLRLAYFLSVQHRVFTNSLYREFGSPVDGGEFRSDPFLKIRRDQLIRDTRSKSVAAERDSLNSRLTAIQIDQGVTTVATKKGLRPIAVPDITARARTQFRLVQGAPVAYESDGRTVRGGKDDAAAMALEEWVDGW